MSAKLDKPLDELIAEDRKSNSGRGRGRGRGRSLQRGGRGGNRGGNAGNSSNTGFRNPLNRDDEDGGNYQPVRRDRQPRAQPYERVS